MSILYAGNQPICKIVEPDPMTEWFNHNTNQTCEIIDNTNPVQSEITNLERQIEMLNFQSNMQRQNSYIMQEMWNTTQSISSGFNGARSFMSGWLCNNTIKTNTNDESITISVKKAKTIGEAVSQLLFILKKILPKITPDNVDKWTLHISLDPHKIKEKKKQ